MPGHLVECFMILRYVNYEVEYLTYLEVLHVLPEAGQDDAGDVTEADSLEVEDGDVTCGNVGFADDANVSHEEQHLDVIVVDEVVGVCVAQPVEEHLVVFGRSLRQGNAITGNKHNW